tara:strand:+ start:2061 stop:2687 length:627 start_codon:yes stop_codon:yes gene_type:complete
MLFLLFVFFKIVVAEETSAILFCVPQTLKITDSNVFNNIKECLDDNFVRIRNETVINVYVNAYERAWAAKIAAEQADDKLFLSKHEMTISMRDLRIQASRHIHAVESCAAISHRMPSTVVDTFTDEAAMMFQVSDLWMHHIQVDLNRCYELMKKIVTNSHRHAAHHLQTLFIHHRHLLVHSEEKHTEEIHAFQGMLDARQDIIDAVNI